jgi:hypothetical protein
MASLVPVRILYALLVVAMAVGGYFAMGEPQGILNLIVGLTLATAWSPSLVLILVTQTDANRRRLVWWIALPFRRRTLLFARWAAVWATALKGAAGLTVALLLGAAVRRIFGEAAPVQWDRDGFTALYIVSALLAVGLLLSGVGLAQPAAYRNSYAAWLLLPITFGSTIGPLLAIRWLDIDRILVEGVGPSQWWTAAACAAGAIALGGTGLALGAKWLHLYLVNTQEAAQRLRGASQHRRRPFL